MDSEISSVLIIRIVLPLLLILCAVSCVPATMCNKASILYATVSVCLSARKSDRVLFENHWSLFSVCCTLHMERTPHWASLVRYSLLHYHLSHIAVHHLHHLHYHRLHLLLLVQSFILNLRLRSANPFLHRPFPFLPDWLHW